MLGDINEK